METKTEGYKGTTGDILSCLTKNMFLMAGTLSTVVDLLDRFISHPLPLVIMLLREDSQWWASYFLKVAELLYFSYL